jgi:hypothetical protein
VLTITINGFSNMTSLISMQSSLQSINAVQTAQNELETQAEIYKPDSSVGFAGDPEKADALTSRAQNLNSKIGQITSNVQTTIQETTEKSSSADSQNSKTDTVQDSSTTDPQSSQDSTQEVSAQPTYDSSGKLVSGNVTAGIINVASDFLNQLV